MPILKSAAAVEVVAVGTERSLPIPFPAPSWRPILPGTGVNVTVKNLVVQPNGIAGALREQATLFNADLLVMGAFNHSVVREWVLGGVTQSLLRDSPVPLLMSIERRWRPRRPATETRGPPATDRPDSGI